MYECYANIIALASKDCPCLAAGRPENYAETNSGLALDQLAPITGLLSTAECDETVWTMLQNSIDSGIKTVVADSNGLLGQKYKLKRKNAYAQAIGKIKEKDVYENSKNYGVLRMRCCPIRGGYFNLKNIGTVFSAAGVVNVELYDNVNGLLETYPLDTLANKHSKNTIAKQLPLYSKYVENLEYYFVYQFDAENMPKDTQIDCGCGSVAYAPVWDLENPYFYGRDNRKMPWGNFAMVGAMEINSLSEIIDQDEDCIHTSCSNNAIGLVLEGDFGCKVNEVVCEDALDFESNPLALSLAHAVRYAAAKELADRVLRSSEFDRENLINTEEWEEAVVEWNERYQVQINYIVQNIDHTANDCLKCRDIVAMTSQGLFA